MKLKKYLKEEDFKGLKFTGISKPDKNNYRAFIFEDNKGNKIKPALLNTGLSHNTFTQVKKLLINDLGKY